MCYFIGIDELSTVENIRQHSVGGGGFPGSITASDDIQHLAHFNLQKYTFYLDWQKIFSALPHIFSDLTLLGLKYHSSSINLSCG